MTPRERFVKTLNFGAPDRVFYRFGNPRKATLEAWYRQGLPAMPEAGEYGCPEEFHGMMREDPMQWGLPVNTGMFPAFEERIIEETDEYRIWQDGLGIIMKDAGRHLKEPGFRTRSYLSHPVRDWDTWRAMRERFDPHTPGRYPDDWEAQAAQLNQRDFPILHVVNSLYWKARDFVGFEDLSVMFYDQPDLVHDIMEHLTVFIIEVLDRALRDVPIEGVMLSEDMSYKHAMMISPAMFQEFMMPRYKRIVRFLKERGVDLVMVDSDGHVSQLLPLWIEAGVDVAYPIEIAALNDPIAYRKQYGNAIGFFGCIDKREIRTPEQTYAEIMGRIAPLMEAGGILPSMDHAVPPDADLHSFLYMAEMIKCLAEGKPVPGPEKARDIAEEYLSRLA